MENNPNEAAVQIRKAMLPNPTVSWLRGIVGAVIGAVIGFLLYKWLLSMDYYGGMLPGGFIGVGFGVGAARRMGWPAGIACGLAGLVFGCWADTVTNDPPQSLIQYVQDYQRIPDINKIMIALGAVASGWFARGR